MNAALLSRSKVYVLKPLTPEAIRRIVSRAVTDRSAVWARWRWRIDDDALAAIAGTPAATPESR